MPEPHRGRGALRGSGQRSARALGTRLAVASQLLLYFAVRPSGRRDSQAPGPRGSEGDPPPPPLLPLPAPHSPAPSPPLPLKAATDPSKSERWPHARSRTLGREEAGLAASVRGRRSGRGRDQIQGLEVAVRPGLSWELGDRLVRCIGLCPLSWKLETDPHRGPGTAGQGSGRVFLQPHLP